MTYTRKQYLAGECTHREYYGQFVTPMMARSIVAQIGAETITNSRDKHFNDITLRLWDTLAIGSIAANAMKDCGDYLTLAGKVCIAKEAARQWLETHAQEDAA